MSRRPRRELKFSGGNDDGTPSIAVSNSMGSGSFGTPQNTSNIIDDGSHNQEDIYHYLNPNLEKIENELIQYHSNTSAANVAKDIIRIPELDKITSRDASGRNSPSQQNLEGSLSGSGASLVQARALAKAKEAAKRKADPVLVQSSAVSYEGGIDSATGLYEGRGKLITIFGYEYQGQFKQGLMHGEGTIRWIKNDITYSGSFENNSITGRGRYEWPSGDSYTGDVLNGLRHGEGSMFVKTKQNDAKSSYVGQWVNGKRHGTGMQIYPDQSKYQGDWFEDRRCGKGTMTYTGDSAGTYEGEWKNDIRHGQGKMKWDHLGGSYELYEGAWVRGYPHGHGVATFVRVDPASNRILVTPAGRSGHRGGGGGAPGSTTSGFFLPPTDNNLSGTIAGLGDGTQLSPTTAQALTGTQVAEHGPSQETTKAVNRYDGDFCAGKRHGFGSFVFDDGSQYEGFWRDNVKHGEGKFTTANGVVFAATFDNGVATRPLDEKALRPDSLYVPTILPLYIVDILGPSEIASADTMSSIQALISRHYGLLRKVFLHYCNIVNETAVPFCEVDLEAPRAHGSMLLLQFLKFCSDSRLVNRHVTIAAIGRMFLQFKDRDSTTQSTAFFAESPLLAAATAAAGVGEVNSKSDGKGRRGRGSRNNNTNSSNIINATSNNTTTINNNNNSNTNNNSSSVPGSPAIHTGEVFTEDAASAGNHQNNSSSSPSATTTTNPPPPRGRATRSSMIQTSSNTNAGGNLTKNASGNSNNHNNQASSPSSGINNSYHNNNNSNNGLSQPGAPGSNNQNTLSSLVKGKLNHPWATFASKELHNWEKPSPNLQFRDFVEAVIRIACMLYNEPFYGTTAQKFQIVIEEHIFRFAGGAQPLNGLSQLNSSGGNFFPLSRVAAPILSSYKPQLRKLFDRFSDVSSLSHDVPRVAGQAPKEAIITLRQFGWILKLMGLLKQEGDGDSSRNAKSGSNRGKKKNTNNNNNYSLGLNQQYGSGAMSENEASGDIPPGLPSWDTTATTTASQQQQQQQHQSGGSNLGRRASIARSDVSTPPYFGGGDRIPADNVSISYIIDKIRTHASFAKTLEQGGVSLSILRHLWPYDSQLRFSRAMLKKYFLISLKPRSKKQEQKQQQQLGATTATGNNNNNAAAASTMRPDQSTAFFGGVGASSMMLTSNSVVGESPAASTSRSMSIANFHGDRSVSVAGTLSQQQYERSSVFGGDRSTMNNFNSTMGASTITAGGGGGGPRSESVSQMGHANLASSRSGSPAGSAVIDDATYESLLKSKLRVLDASCGSNGSATNLDNTVSMDTELTFIEFVELLCRVADVVYQGSDVGEKLLQLMFNNVGPIVDVAHTVQI